MARTKKAKSAKRNAAAAAGAAGASGSKHVNTNTKKQNKKQKVDASASASVSASTSAKAQENDSKTLAAVTLKELLGGMDLDTFFAQYFEKKPLHVRSNGKHKLFPRGLFSKKRVLETIQRHDLDYGKDLTICKYVDRVRENFDGESEDGASRAKVARLFDQGFSCQFYQPQRYVDELFKINAAFETHFGSLAGASAYLTPPGAQALAPHHDDVEVFILQTEGRKKWQLYHPITELAGEHSNDLSSDQIGEPWMELTLEEGDVLYFPRGVVHQAATDDKQFSTHVTISVYQHTAWANFLEVALPRVIRRAFDSDVAFRRGLPVAYLDFMGSQFDADSAQAQAFAKTLKTLVTKLADNVDAGDLQQAADEAAMDFVANRLPPATVSTSMTAAQTVSPTDDGIAVRFKDRSHIRLTMGEDELKEPFIGVYYSSQNCRTHHMGLCTCRGDDEGEGSGSEGDGDGEGSDSDGEGSDDGEGDDGSDNGARDENDGSDDGDHDGDDDDDEMRAAMGQLPVAPRSIAFPADLAAPLMKLYASYPAFVPLTSLTSDDDGDDDSLRAMIVRLWCEGVVEVAKQ